MAEQVSLSGPIEIDDRARVALDLARIISADEGMPKDKRDRRYWLTLYSHCNEIVHRRAVKDILEGWPARS